MPSARLTGKADEGLLEANKAGCRVQSLNRDGGADIILTYFAKDMARMLQG